jgi:hypothetical protein
MATPQIWNGTSWAALTKAKARYYNGSTWVEPSDIKYWTGSTWASIFPAAGTVALRASGSNNVNTTNSIGVTIPASTQAGDFMVLVVAQNSNLTTLFNAISGWTKQAEERAGAAAYTIAIYTRLAQGGDASSTVTATSANTANMTAQVRVFSGVNQSSPLDAAVITDELATAGITASAPAVTIATVGSMIMTVYGIPATANTTLTGADWTDPSGFSNELATCTNNTDINPALVTYTKSAVATGSNGPFSATSTQSKRWSLATIAIRPA